MKLISPYPALRIYRFHSPAARSRRILRKLLLIFLMLIRLPLFAAELLYVTIRSSPFLFHVIPSDKRKDKGYGSIHRLDRGKHRPYP